jgi:hypothetical protein
VSTVILSGGRAFGFMSTDTFTFVCCFLFENVMTRLQDRLMLSEKGLEMDERVLHDQIHCRCRCRCRRCLVEDVGRLHLAHPGNRCVEGIPIHEK